MALRVLLADESPTIKKVFQLALQDFNVDVSSVNLGGDVLPVAARVQPDIIFIDVLLQKKNGYEVAREIKTNAELRTVPIVLIWSGFMELDQDKFRASGADGHLEKPFDTEKLRDLVKRLVPKTQTQTLSPFLEFPDLPDFVDDQKSSQPVLTPPPMATPPPVAPSPAMEAGAGGSAPAMSGDSAGSWTMESFEPLQPPAVEEITDDFMAVELPSEPPRLTPTHREPGMGTPSVDDDDRAWVQKSITQFKLPKEKTVEEKPQVHYTVPSETIDPNTIVTNAQWTRSTSAPPPVPKAAPVDDDSLELDLGTEESSVPRAVPELNEKQLEAIIRAQAKDVVERVVWQVLPEIASRIIERELEKLLKEREKY